MEPARLPFLLCVVDLQRLCAAVIIMRAPRLRIARLSASERKFIRSSVIALFALNWVYLLMTNPSL